MVDPEHPPADRNPEQRHGTGGASAGADRRRVRTEKPKENRDPPQLVVRGRIATDGSGQVAWKLVESQQLETGIEAQAQQILNAAGRAFQSAADSMDSHDRALLHRLIAAELRKVLELRFTGTLSEAAYTFGNRVLAAELSRSVRELSALAVVARSSHPIRWDYAELTWIDDPVHLPQVEAEPEPTRPSIDLAQLVVPPLAQVSLGLSTISDGIQSRNAAFAESLREELRTLEGRTFESAAEAQSFARGLRRILLSLGHRVECSEPARDGSGRVCGTPSFVDCYEHGSAPFWVFRFHHVGDDRKHGHFHALPRLAVVQAPPDKRRKQR